MKFGWTLLGLALAQGQGGNKKPFNGEKKFQHLSKVYSEMLNHFFLNSAAAIGPEASNVERRQAVVDRFGSKYQGLLDDFDTLWNSCGNQSGLASRTMRYDKTNWKKAINQLRNGYNKLLNNELGTCTEGEDAKVKARLSEKISRWSHNLGYQYCKKVSPNDTACHKRRPNFQKKRCAAGNQNCLDKN